MSFQPGRAATACKTASGLTPSGCMPSLNGAAVQVAHQSIPLTRQGDPMNRLTLTGRLTADPELRYSTEGTAFCSMRIAVNGVGDDEAMFLDITTFGKEAEACSQHLHKGRRIGFDGPAAEPLVDRRRRHQAQQVQRRGSRRVSRQRATCRRGRRAGDNACCRER
jgi:hypothetical protein